MGNAKRTALVKARERRVALDCDRAARDSRVEQATARVYLAVEQRAAAAQAVHQANAGIGAPLRELLTERISVEDAATLCDLDPPEVRRLVRLAAARSGPAGPARAPVPGRATGLASSANVTQLRRPPTQAVQVEPAGSNDEGGQADAGRRAE